MEKKEFQNQYCKLWVEDGIVFAKYSDGLEIDLEIAKSLVQSRVDFQDGTSYPLFMDFGVKTVGKDARDYMNKEGIQLINAGAFFTESLLSKIFVNFFLKVANPPVPAKLFTDKKEAIKWLQKYKN